MTESVSEFNLNLSFAIFILPIYRDSCCIAPFSKVVNEIVEPDEVYMLIIWKWFQLTME